MVSFPSSAKKDIDLSKKYITIFSIGKKLQTKESHHGLQNHGKMHRLRHLQAGMPGRGHQRRTAPLQDRPGKMHRLRGVRLRLPRERH